MLPHRPALRTPSEGEETMPHECRRQQCPEGGLPEDTRQKTMRRTSPVRGVLVLLCGLVAISTAVLFGARFLF